MPGLAEWLCLGSVPLGGLNHNSQRIESRAQPWNGAFWALCVCTHWPCIHRDVVLCEWESDRGDIDVAMYSIFFRSSH